mmetsp:Transcript_161302/g.297525  ORF Transcript_161302/g.297525 Transcript_161302/m.297525 type:complete len:726 (+) Transcript_161302:47-2224(+)
MASAARCKIFSCIEEDDASCSDVSFLESMPANPGDIDALTGEDTDQAKIRVLRTQRKLVKVVQPHKVEAATLRKVAKPTVKGIQASGSFSPQGIQSGGPSSPHGIQATALASPGSGFSTASSLSIPRTPSNSFIPTVGSKVEAQVRPSESFDSLQKSSSLSTPMSVTPLHSARVRKPAGSGQGSDHLAKSWEPAGDALGSGAVSPPTSMLSSPPHSARVSLSAQPFRGIPGLSLQKAVPREGLSLQSTPQSNLRDVQSTPRLQSSPQSSLRDVQSSAQLQSSPVITLRDVPSGAQSRSKSPSSFLALERMEQTDSFVPPARVNRVNEPSTCSSMQQGHAAQDEEDAVTELGSGRAQIDVGALTQLDMNSVGAFPQDELLRNDLMRSASGTTTPATLPPQCFTPSTIPPGPLSPGTLPPYGIGLGAPPRVLSPHLPARLPTPCTVSSVENKSWWRKLPTQDGANAVASVFPVNGHKAGSFQPNAAPFKPNVGSFRSPGTPVPSTTASFQSSRPDTPSRSSSGTPLLTPFRLVSAPAGPRMSLTRLRSGEGVTRSPSPTVVRPPARPPPVRRSTQPGGHSPRASHSPRALSVEAPSLSRISPGAFNRVCSFPRLSSRSPAPPTPVLNARSPPAGSPRTPRVSTRGASSASAGQGWFFKNGQQQTVASSPKPAAAPSRLPSAPASPTLGHRLSMNNHSPRVGGYREPMLNRMKSMMVVKCAPPGSMPS